MKHKMDGTSSPNPKMQICTFLVMPRDVKHLSD